MCNAMYIKLLKKRTSYVIGTPYVPYGSDKLHSSIHENDFHVKSVCRRKSTLASPRNTSSGRQKLIEDSFYRYLTCVYSWFICIFPYVYYHSLCTAGGSTSDGCVVWKQNRALLVFRVILSDLIRTETDCCVIFLKVEFTVQPLYAGTLVIYWTTAPSIYFFRHQRAQLASILLLFISLTIVCRCYASPSSTHFQLSQLRQQSYSSPIRNSKIHSSSIVLFRLIQSSVARKGNAFSPIQRTKRELTRFNFNHISEDSIPESKTRVPTVDREKDTYWGKSSTLTDSNGTQVLIGSHNGENFSEIVSAAGNFSRVFTEKLNYSSSEVHDSYRQLPPQQNAQPMPPAYGHSNNSSVDKWGVLSIIVSSVALTVTLGLITCILSHYRAEAAPEGGGTASDPNNAALTPTSAPMLSVVSAGATAGVGGMERLRGGRAAARDLAAARERQVRLHALRTDLAVNLPPSITMPDGEDHPYSNARIHIRDAEQEAEIYQKCIRPPPNRTVLESESPPPYRSSSAGLLGSSSSSSSSADWSTSAGTGNAPLVVRCHSMSSTTKRPEAGTSGQKTDFLQRTVKIFTGKKTTPQAPSPAPTLPAVVVPSGSRRRPPDQNQPPTTHRPSKGGV